MKSKPKLRFKEELKKKKTARNSFWLTFFISGFVLLILAGLAAFATAGYVFYKYSEDLPDVNTLKGYLPSTITQIYSDQDELIAEFYVEKRVIVPFEKIPLMLQQATLAVEDSDFYEHFGINIKAILRAALANLRAGHVVEGGSTITQQLSKTLFLSRAKSLERKVREAILAIRLEQSFSKDEILELYLNQIYYGHGSYGVEAAAQTYFGKHIQDLGIEECAMLASLPKAPNYYSPYRNPQQAHDRKNHAVRRMAALNYITEEQAEKAIKSELKLGELTEMLNKAPYFVEYVRQFLEDSYGSTKLYREGLKVYTTLNLNYQTIAQEAVQENLRNNDKRYGYRGPLGHLAPGRSRQDIHDELKKHNFESSGSQALVAGGIVKGVVMDMDSSRAYVEIGDKEGIIHIEDMNWARHPDIKVDGEWIKIKTPDQALSHNDIILVKLLTRRSDGKWELALEQIPEVEGGLLSIAPHTGYIKALVGGYDFSKSQFNRALQAVRQPGSAFKPIVYAAAINEGFTPASIIIDSPVIFKENETQGKWKPANFEEKFYGPTNLRTALTHSRNVVTIKLLQDMGVQKAIQFARTLGIGSPLEENLSIALGSSGLTLFDLTSAYATFANLGRKIEPTAIRHIKDRDGKIIYTSQPKSAQVISSGTAYIITNMMESVVQDGTAKKVKALHRPVAGKTGTTNSFVDAWFMGFTPDLVTGVWVGKDKDEPLGVNETGSRAAIPIWLQYMEGAHDGIPIKNFPVPDDVVYIKINPETGKRVAFSDPQGEFEVFMRDHPPEHGMESSSPVAEVNF